MLVIALQLPWRLDGPWRWEEVAENGGAGRLVDNGEAGRFAHVVHAGIEADAALVERDLD